RRPEAISRSREGRIHGCGPRTRIDTDDEETHSSRTSLIVRIGKDVVTTAAAMADPLELAAIGSAPLQLRGRAPGTPVGGQGTHRFSLMIEHKQSRTAGRCTCARNPDSRVKSSGRRS